MRYPECASCGKPIRWVSGRNNKRMPLDPEPAPDGNIVIGEDGLARVLKRAELAALPADTPRYRSHFSTCPDAAAHRK